MKKCENSGKCGKCEKCEKNVEKYFYSANNNSNILVNDYEE